MARLLLTLALLLVSARAAAKLPDDARLAPARAQLEATFTAATREGVPESILADKVNEGLAKGVPAARLAAVVSALEQSLAAAGRLVTPHLASPPPSLLKALVEARTAGAPARDLEALIASGAPRGAQPLTRALDVVTDLSQRGFQPALAAHTVSTVLAHSPGALDQVAGQAQVLAARSGVSRAEALDAIARATERGLGVDRAAEALSHSPPGLDDRGPNRESSSQRGPGKDHGKGHP